MSAEWTCQRCGASVLGSECSCMDERDKRIAELKSERDRLRSDIQKAVELMQFKSGCNDAVQILQAALLREE